MALILNIDTATEVASVCLALNGRSLAFTENQHQREHATFVHAAILSIMSEAGVQLKDIEAFAVTAGPGSYTGLRVGMATAKGFCYSFSKPLIAINTLEVMAMAALRTIGETDQSGLLCPMIDARRMEVFAAVYDYDLKTIRPPKAIILDETTFQDELMKSLITFFGNGSIKFKELATTDRAVFKHVDHTAKNLASLADIAFEQKKFSDVVYSQPTYFKDFHSLSKGSRY